MKCIKPFRKGLSEFGCGQCMPCRYNKRRMWTHRIMLEALVHEVASFVTLTYDDDNLPANGSLDPYHLQCFLKRLRKNSGLPIRFFGVGEYGEKRARPHYHLALFGIDEKCGVGDYWVSLRNTNTQRFDRPECVIDRSWELGNVFMGTLTYDSAQYIAKYTTKKMTGVDDDRLCGRYPEFARMSLRPGIGAPAIATVGHYLESRHGWDVIESRGDVPDVLRHGRRNMPLGRYLRQRLRAALEWENIGEPEIASIIRAEKMRSVLQSYLLPEEGEFQLYKAKARMDEEEGQKAVQLMQRHGMKVQKESNNETE